MTHREDGRQPQPPRAQTTFPGPEEGVAPVQGDAIPFQSSERTPSGAAVRTAPPALRPGDRLGRWVLERVLGEGATATVWAARHERLGSPVAVKVFHRRGGRGVGFEAVLAEARAAAGIPSPYVIWVYDVDTFDGYNAIVMERCGTDDATGQSLRERPPAAPREAVRLVAQAARGVEAAHAGGVFHKDIKPANILVRPQDGRAQITDFGLANPALWRREMRATGEAPALARPGATVSHDLAQERVRRSEGDTLAFLRGPVRVGTPEFMAPEQAAGLRADLDPRDARERAFLAAIDVWGLGATLYALLAGRPPYPVPADALEGAAGAGDAGERATGEPYDAVRVMEQVAAVPHVPLARVRPDLPPALCALVDGAMARDPRDRPTVGRLAEDLEAWLATRPTSLDRAWWQRARVHLRRERSRVLLVGALVVTALGSTAITSANIATIREQSDEIARRRTEVDALERTRSALEGTLLRVERALDSTRNELSSKTILLGDREREISAQSADLARLSDDLVTVQSQLADTTLQLDGAAARVQALEEERSALSAELDATRMHLDASVAALDGARASVVGARREADAASARADALAEDLRAAQAQVVQLASLLEATRAARDAAQGDVARLRSDLEVAEARSRELEAEVAMLRTAQMGP